MRVGSDSTGVLQSEGIENRQIGRAPATRQGPLRPAQIRSASCLWLQYSIANRAVRIIDFVKRRAVPGWVEYLVEGGIPETIKDLRRIACEPKSLGTQSEPGDLWKST